MRCSAMSCAAQQHQKIDRLLILNGHGGNEFKPLVRDLQSEFKSLIVVANFFQVAKYQHDPRCKNPGDHADEMETSLLLHLCPEWVKLNQAGKGDRIPFKIPGLNQPGIWTPRPWSASHPDTGSGDPSYATAEKGRQFFETISDAIANVLVGMSRAAKGELPYT